VGALWLLGCARSPARDANEGQNPIVRTGLRLALDGDTVVIATWVTRGGPAPIDQTLISRMPKALGGAVLKVAVLDGKVRAFAISTTGDLAVTRVQRPKLVVVPRGGGAERVVSSLGELVTKHAFGYT